MLRQHHATPTLAAAALVLAGCRAPTEMKFSLTTDVPCDKVTGVAIAVGTADDFDGRAVATTSTTCTSGDLGSIVTVPLHDKDSSMGFKAVLGVGRDPADCATSFGTGCVVARRVLSYIPHTRLYLDVALNGSCLGVACEPNQTCVAGACTSASIANAGACTSTCSEGSLPAATSSALVPSPKLCGDMSGLESGAAWPMQGFCPTRLGRSPRLGAQTNHVRWTATIGAAIHGGASIAHSGIIYVVATDGRLYAVSPAGTIAWSSRAASGFGQTVGAIGQDGTLYAGNSDGNLYAFVNGGGVKWTHQLSTGSVWPSPAITGSGLTIVGGGTGGSSVFAIDATGAQAWQVTTGADVLSSPAIGVDGTIYVGSEDKNLYALNPDGSKKWTFTATEPLQSPVVAENGAIYVAGKPSVCAVDASRGTLLWVTPTAQDATTPAFAGDGTVYAGDASGQLYALDGQSGGVKWQVALTAFDVSVQPIIGADGVVYIGATDGTFYAVAPYGAVLWQLATGSAIRASPAMGADGAIYFGTEDGRLFAVGP